MVELKHQQGTHRFIVICLALLFLLLVVGSLCFDRALRACGGTAPGALLGGGFRAGGVGVGVGASLPAAGRGGRVGPAHPRLGGRVVLLLLALRT